MTIYDIAKAAGVSPSSVSRVLNNKPGVNPQKRELIQKLLTENRYLPNHAPTVKAAGCPRMIGILVADVRTLHHTEGAYYISQAMNEHGYSSLIFNTGGSDSDRVEGIRMLSRHNVLAAVLMGSIFQSDAIAEAIAQYLPDTPIFMLNGFIDLPNVYSVLSDDRAGTRSCVRLLAEKNRRRIAYLVDAPTPSSQLKVKGFIDGMLELGCPRKELWIYAGLDGSLQSGYDTAVRLLREHPDVNGIVCGLDILACGVLHALHDANLAVPEQIAVIGTDNSIYAEIATPPLTSLDTMILDSSIAIAHKIIDCFESRKTNQRTLLYTSIVQRGST